MYRNVNIWIFTLFMTNYHDINVHMQVIILMKIYFSLHFFSVQLL